MPNPSLRPSRVPWEKRKQGRGSIPGEREKLSTSRASLWKMETVSEVKGTGNSQGFGARGQQESKGRADLTQETPAGPWGASPPSALPASARALGRGAEAEARPHHTCSLASDISHHPYRRPGRRTRGLDFPPPLREEGGWEGGRGTRTLPRSGLNSPLGASPQARGPKGPRRLALP